MRAQPRPTPWGTGNARGNGPGHRRGAGGRNALAVCCPRLDNRQGWTRCPVEGRTVFGLEETPLDLKWRMFGIHVRVHPLFWLVAAILSKDLLLLFGIPHFLVGIACIFFSILIHELGHVVVGRYFGSHGHIVLWGLGGLAIGSNNLHARWKRVAVLFAGPLAQFVLLGIVWLGWPYLPLPVRGETVSELLLVAAVTLYYVNL